MIEIKHLSKTFNTSTILKDVNAVVHDGDVIAVIGLSGTGKSTFIRCLNLLNTPSSGQILLNGTDITAPGTDVSLVRRKIGMVFQQFNLFKNLTVLENVIIPQMDILGRSRQEACEVAVKNLKAVGMYERLLKYPSALSGGQQQRVAIARTLSMDPEIILFDEPTSALDPTLVGEVEYIIEKLAAEGRTMIIVTHEMHFARKVSNRIFYMDEGGIYEDGTPEQIFNNPQREKTKRFINQTRYLDIVLNRQTSDIPGIFSKIAVFGDSLDLMDRGINRLQMIFEELCIETILPGLNDLQEIHMIIESSERSDSIDIKVHYDGKQLCKDSLNTVSGKMIMYAADEIEFYDKEIRIRLLKQKI